MKLKDYPVEDAIEEIKSDYIAKKMCANDYSAEFKNALSILIKAAREYDKLSKGGLSYE